MNFNSDLRRSSSVGLIVPTTCGNNSRAATLKSAGHSASHGSGSSSASSTARLDASGRRAHHRCSVDGWPWRIDFSRAACFDTVAMGKSTSARRRQFGGIIRKHPSTEIVYVTDVVDFFVLAYAVHSCTTLSGTPSSSAALRFGSCSRGCTVVSRPQFFNEIVVRSTN
jgi:hypothetical protein